MSSPHSPRRPDGMSRSEFIDAIADRLRNAIVRAVVRELDSMTRSCVNCNNFAQNSEVCNLVNQRPPARIIANGCEKHEDIERF